MLRRATNQVRIENEYEQRDETRYPVKYSPVAFVSALMIDAKEVTSEQITLVDVATKGIGFKCDKQIQPGTSAKLQIMLQKRDSEDGSYHKFDRVAYAMDIHIRHSREVEDGQFMHGCRIIRNHTIHGSNFFINCGAINMVEKKELA